MIPLEFDLLQDREQVVSPGMMKFIEKDLKHQHDVKVLVLFVSCFREFIGEKMLSVLRHTVRYIIDGLLTAGFQA